MTSTGCPNPPAKELHFQKGRRFGFLLLSFSLVAGGGCRLYRLEQRLGPGHADFLSKVRYIITGEERKNFLKLPDSAKDGFIEDFWERRDPDPDTEVNEFKNEYNARVKRSEELFRGEGRPGWMTDRGRIYILFGPPQERITFPMDAAGNCREIWYYGNFPVLFIDEHCSNNFMLTAINLEHLQELNIAQGYFQKTIVEGKPPFDYDVDIRKIRSDDLIYEARIIIDIPYRRIWFALEEGRLKTSYDVRLELKNDAGAVIWESEKAFDLETDEEELKSNKDESYSLELPLLLEENLSALRGEKLSLHIHLSSGTGGQKLEKTLDFRLEF